MFEGLFSGFRYFRVLDCPTRTSLEPGNQRCGSRKIGSEAKYLRKVPGLWSSQQPSILDEGRENCSFCHCKDFQSSFER